MVLMALGMVPTCLPKARDGHDVSAYALGLLGLVTLKTAKLISSEILIKWHGSV